MAARRTSRSYSPDPHDNAHGDDGVDQILGGHLAGAFRPAVVVRLRAVSRKFVRALEHDARLREGVLVDELGDLFEVLSDLVPVAGRRLGDGGTGEFEVVGSEAGRVETPVLQRFVEMA